MGGNTFRWKFVERDEKLIGMLIELETKFWEHVKNMTPSPLDGSDASAKFLAARFPGSITNSQINLPASASELLAQYDEACEKIEYLTEQKQRAENMLKEMLGENEVGTAGDRVITWKSISQERLASKTLKAEHPKLYQRYANNGNKKYAEADHHFGWQRLCRPDEQCVGHYPGEHEESAIDTVRYCQIPFRLVGRQMSKNTWQKSCIHGRIIL